MKRLKSSIAGLGLVTIAMTGCSSVLPTTPPVAQSVSTQTMAPASTRSEPALSMTPSSPDFVAKIVQDVGPAVVRIDSSRVVDQPFGEMQYNPFGGGRSQQQPVQRGTGSGFITSADGRIFTNAHVVQGADNVSVLLKDGRRFKGEVVGSDPATDVAVIKISATGLPTVKLGDSGNLLPGQAAIAIGNPLGLDNTVTQGIISATGRSGADFGSSSRVSFIQTDTAINPGNSGGPLINSRGEVIGMNTAIIQGASGIGFAVPIGTAQRVAEQLVSKGRVDHPFLGIQMAELTPELRDQINSNTNVRLNREQGVIVMAVQPNSPAAAAGFKAGDVIEDIDGTAIAKSQEVQQKVDSTPLGNTLKVTINRGGQSQTLTVKPAQMPAQTQG